MTGDKLNWDVIMDELLQGNLIPVIGSELLKINIDGERKYFRLWLAKKLAGELDLSVSGLEDDLHPVQTVMLRYYQKGENPRGIIPYQISKSLINRKNWETPEALLKLAKIKHFRFYLTTMWEPFLEHAIMESWGIKKNQLNILENNLSDRPDDIVKFTSKSALLQFDPSYVEKLYNNTAPPTIYYLFGRPTSYNSFALSEDDILKANLLFQSCTYRPDELIRFLSERRFLMLGCNFPNWLARFFVSLPSIDPKTPSPQPVFVMSDSVCCRDQSLAGFLKRHDAYVITDITVEHFIDKFYDYWKGKIIPPPEFEEGSLFISYASEDREIAESLRNQINEMGIPVWLDRKELKPGDEWARVIEENISKSKMFLPIISKSSVQACSERFFYQEWQMVKNILSESELPKVMPVRVDETGYDDKRIPEGFFNKQWIEAPNGVISDKSMAELVAEYRKPS